MKVVILNGAPFSGKDTIADMMVEKFDYKKMSFKQPLIEFAVRTSGVTQEYWDRCYERDLKEEPNACYLIDGKHVSPRNYLIHISENVIKPMLGNAFFGEKMRDNILAECDGSVVISDGGFLEEMLPLAEAFDLHLVRLHRDGTSFEGDSRSHLYPDEKLVDKQKDFYNNGSVEEIAEKISEWVK